MIAPLSFLGIASVLSSFLMSGVNGHGYVQNVTIGGKTYPGWDPNIDPYAQPIPKRVIRKIPDDGPITDVTSSDLACNTGGEQGAGLVADAQAGSQVKWVMNRWPDDHLGPVFHYMASCNGDCTKFDATKAKWFKVEQDGYDNGVWATTKLITNNLEVSMTIPAELKAGEYLIRHELVALHDASQPQFYPSCAQVNVQGSGTQEPAASDLVSIPGVYSNVKFPDIWDNFHSFTLPAPTVAFASGGSASGGSTSSPAESSSVHPSSASSHPASSHPAGTSATPSHTSAPTSAARPTTSSSIISAPASSATGRCKSRLARRRAPEERMVKRHVGHAKRHHH